MEKQIKRKKSFVKLTCIFLASCFFIACNDEPDNYYGLNKFSLELGTSSNLVKLNEDTPDDIALTLEWTPATDMGNDYVIHYTYEVQLVGDNTKNPIKEYEDDAIFKRSYTHKELQDLLVDRWGQLTGTSVSLQFTVTADIKGMRTVVPEIATKTIKLKTYGPKQFLADKLFMSGTAVGEDDIELLPSTKDSKVYVYTGNLAAGNLNFPFIYDDEVKENVISPLVAEQAITDDAMEAAIKDQASAGVWVISNPEPYRVTVDFTNKTVTIIPVGDIIDLDNLYLAGTAVSAETEITQTLEDENIYAFKGELKAGKLYLPILFDGNKATSIVPKESGAQDISDGVTVPFALVDTDVAESSRYWNIPADDTYRIVVNIDTKTITIYSSVNDLQPMVKTWKNTVIGNDNYSEEVVALWMYGGFNGWNGDGSSAEAGFSETYKLVPSQASPYIFVYKGEVLPRKSENGSIKFCVSNIKNNVYAYGASATHSDHVSVAAGTTYTAYEGQGDNRYAYFKIPENINFVVVDIEKMTVVFDYKE